MPTDGGESQQGKRDRQPGAIKRFWETALPLRDFLKGAITIGNAEWVSHDKDEGKGDGICLLPRLADACVIPLFRAFFSMQLTSATFRVFIVC